MITTRNLWSRYALGQAHGQINKQDILIGCGVNIMAEYQCTCHCGGDMFYRHMHAESCPLSIYGDEVPGTEVDTLKRQVADLTRRLEEAQARAQRPPEPYESVCHACDGSGWVSA